MTVPLQKTSKQNLPVYFTEEELQALGLQLASAHQTIAALNEEKKASADRFKSRIDTATAEAGRFARLRIDGYEHRLVECETTYDFERMSKRTTRIDTGELVEEGPMTESEKKLAQMVFDEASGTITTDEHIETERDDEADAFAAV